MEREEPPDHHRAVPAQSVEGADAANRSELAASETLRDFWGFLDF